MEILWTSHRFPMEILWTSHKFPTEILWKSYGNPIDFLWKVYGNPEDFLWKSYGHPIDILWKFPWKSFGNPIGTVEDTHFHRNHWICGDGMHWEYHYEFVGANEHHTTFNRVESTKNPHIMYWFNFVCEGHQISNTEKTTTIQWQSIWASHRFPKEILWNTHRIPMTILWNSYGNPLGTP